MHQISRLEIEELNKRLTWLFSIRWFASIIVFILILISHSILQLNIKIFPAILIPIFIFFYNFIFSFLIDNIRTRTMFKLVNLQLFLDITSIVLLTYFTGGTENPVSFLCIFPLIFAGILLPPRNCFFFTFYTITLYNLLIFLSYYNLVPFYHIFSKQSDIFLDRPYILMNTFFFSLTMIITSISIVSIMNRLREKESHIIRLQNLTKKQKGRLEIKAKNLSRLYTLKNSFMLQVEHQLKSPLAGSLSIIDILLNRFKKLSERDKKDFLVAIMKKLKLMQEMIIDLLNLARIKDPDYQPDSEKLWVNINAMIKNVIQNQAGLIQKKKNQIIFNEMEGLEDIFISEKQILLCLSNIIHNAIKYTEKGKIIINLRKKKSFIVIDVIDTGIGISLRDRKNIFREFYRAHNVKDVGIEGTGLGLYITYEVIRKLGGDIKVKSRLGKGSAFSLFIPVH
ncbi:MAG: HAMP domain-containing histidine kinase [Spirochaetes bacterium]|nr:HAMP domain-containing histidine kinase [Spirochaetota bacterium]